MAQHSTIQYLTYEPDKDQDSSETLFNYFKVM